ncbi:MAG: phosphocholine cytidylyltransferase family protein, partial [Bacteroidota bacterium]
EEEIRVKVGGSETIVQIGKDVPLSETYGESIGIEMFSPATATILFDTLERRMRKGAGRK